MLSELNSFTFRNASSMKSASRMLVQGKSFDFPPPLVTSSIAGSDSALSMVAPPATFLGPPCKILGPPCNILGPPCTRTLATGLPLELIIGGGPCARAHVAQA